MVDHAKKRMHDPTTLPALTHIETCIDQVQHWIIYGGWTPSEPIHTQHYEPSNGKLRDIDYVPYWPDGVMHWVLIEAIYDVVVPKMDPYCIHCGPLCLFVFGIHCRVLIAGSLKCCIKVFCKIAVLAHCSLTFC